MRKSRIISLLLAVLLLTGCGKVSTAEEVIAGIGTVTIESREYIEYAESLIADMSQHQLQKVENLPVLVQARAEYDKLDAAVRKANEAILAIGTVTLSSGDAIRTAREAYEDLTADNLTDYVSSNYPILVAAEEQFDYLCAKDIYEEALSCYEQGAYSEAMTILVTLDEQYPNSSFADSAIDLNIKCNIEIAKELYVQGSYETAVAVVDHVLDTYPQSSQADSLKQLGVDCYVASANALYSEGKLEDALSKLSDGSDAYGSAMDVAGASELQDKIEEDLEDIRPKNEKIIAKNSSITGGYGQFTVKASSESDALIKLERADDPSEYVLFYVRAGEEATISVRNGQYNVKYTSGSHWFGEEARFGKDATYTKADRILEFTVEYSGSYVYYSVITMTLYTTFGGNLSTTPISSDAF